MRRPISALRRAVRTARSQAYRVYLRLAYPGIRIGQGVRIARGARLRAFDGGRVEIGRGVHIGPFSLIEVQSGRLSIDDGCEIGPGSMIVAIAHIAIGAGTLIAEYVTIRDQDHRHEGTAMLAQQGLIAAPIRIGGNVWIGAKATITRGVTIADHVAVGANAVVTRSLAERGTYGGVPARRLIGIGDRA